MIMSKLTIKEICKLPVDDQEILYDAVSAFHNSRHLFERFVYMHSIEDFHYILLMGINSALEQIPSAHNLSLEEKEAKIKYLNILKEKIEKSKELLVFL